MRKPEWIRYRIPGGEGYLRVKKTVSDLGLHTICTEGRCPNAGECFASGTATFLIMGDTCTRNCRYCAVAKGVPSAPDFTEPRRVAEAVKLLHLKYAVITSVTRDDIPDGGASLFAETCRCIKDLIPECGIELLVPDFRDSFEQSLDLILCEDIHILNHNIETVRDLFPVLRPAGSYMQSLKLLKYASKLGARVKSGLMIGFGESKDQIMATIEDLIDAGCRIITVGQYLRPGMSEYEVAKFYHPDEFIEIRESALRMGFVEVLAGPNVRSSYHAGISLR